MPDCECVATIAPPSRSTSSARFSGVQVLAGESVRRSARGARRARQRHFGVRHELLVVLERIRRARPLGAGPMRAGPRRHRLIDGIDREQRRDVLVRVGIRLRIGRVAVRNERAGQHGRSGGHEMAEPCGPRAVVGDSPEVRDQLRGALRVAGCDARFGLVQHRLIESRTPAARLIDDVGRDALADEVRIPALTTVRRRLERGTGVRGAVHHDHRPARRGPLRRNLELHVHLADGDLLRRGRRRLLARRRERDRGVVGDLRHAADEEAALILEHELAAHHALRRLTLSGDAAPRA